VKKKRERKKESLTGGGRKFKKSGLDVDISRAFNLPDLKGDLNHPEEIKKVGIKEKH